jgi:nucleoside-diphosphate-sugar epimerase
MGYLASALPPMPEGVVVYLDCHTHGGARELAEDVAKLAAVLDTLGGRRLIYASSAVLYDPAPAWAVEGDRLHPPRTHYALTKVAHERLIALSDADAVVLRLGSIMGAAPEMRWDLLPNRFVWAAVREGRVPLSMNGAQRPLLGIRDAVRAIEWAATAPAGVYNVATENVTVRWLAERVAEQCGAVVEHCPPPAHVPTFTVSTGRARRHGWVPRDDVDRLIAELKERAAAC